VAEAEAAKAEAAEAEAAQEAKAATVPQVWHAHASTAARTPYAYTTEPNPARALAGFGIGSADVVSSVASGADVVSSVSRVSSGADEVAPGATGEAG